MSRFYRSYLLDRFQGCLAMAAIGDALGMATHDLTRDQIRQKFGGLVTRFLSAPSDSRVHPGFVAAQVTDDTLLTLTVARACQAGPGQIDPQEVARLTAEEYTRQEQAGRTSMFGTSTKTAVEAVRAGKDPVAAALAEDRPTVGATNGGAMKISPVGLIHPGRPQEVTEDVLNVCLPTHPTQTAVSAATAIAAGVAEALRSGADVFSVVQACLKGAEAGDKLGREKARTVALPSVPARARLALSLVLNAASTREAEKSLADLIGGGLAAHESIPAAVALFALHGGHPRKCVIAGANYHYDNDTIAAMLGAMSGALHGMAGVPKKMLRQVEEVNGLDLAGVAEELVEVVLSKDQG